MLRACFLQQYQHLNTKSVNLSGTFCSAKSTCKSFGSYQSRHLRPRPEGKQGRGYRLSFVAVVAVVVREEPCDLSAVYHKTRDIINEYVKNFVKQKMDIGLPNAH